MRQVETGGWWIDYVVSVSGYEILPYDVLLFSCSSIDQDSPSLN